MNETINPYNAPESDLTPIDDEKRALREKHINHEATIKSIGILFYLGSIFAILAGIGMLASVFTQANDQNTFFIMFGVFLAALGVIQFWTAGKIRALSPKAKVPANILAVLGLINFPVGTLINAIIIYAINCKKGRFILSDEYRDIVEATPDIKYRTSIIVWIFIVIIVAVIAAAIIIPVFN